MGVFTWSSRRGESLSVGARMLRYAVMVLFALAGVSHALSDAEKAVKPKSECDKKASNCLSFPNSFKCAMSFKNLTDDINILDIIPDLINQPGVTLTDDITKELFALAGVSHALSDAEKA